jgi:hypothetical protein
MSNSIVTTTANTSGIESVKLTLTGSHRAISKIIHTLYSLGFSEVNDWSRPQPTKNPNESPLEMEIKRVWNDTRF